jgi:hypothetical protein
VSPRERRRQLRLRSNEKAVDLLNCGSLLSRRGVIMAPLGGLALLLVLAPSPATAATPAAVVPLTSFTVTSSQCEGPTYLPTTYSALEEVYGELDSLIGVPPGQGASPPVFSSCSPLPAAGSAVYGSASVSSVGTPTGSATVSVQALGNELVEQSANVDTTLTATMTLSSPATSVDIAVPYTTAGLSQTGAQDDAFALVSFSQAAGLMGCTDGSYGTWSVPPGQYDLASPSGSGSGTATVTLFCPDGSQLAPGTVGLGVNLLANAYSDNSQSAGAGANISLSGVTATINP